MSGERQKVFWLHIRKSGGSSVIESLGDAYVRADRNVNPTCFIAADKSQWNDIINNFRTLMGPYTFRRALFAKKYLYKEEWNDLLSFAFAREPVSRCLSMFHYLYWIKDDWKLLAHNIARTACEHKKFPWNEAYAFDVFLDILAFRFSEDRPSIFRPFNLHFTTHTARMSEDICDENGDILLKRVYRLECADAAIAECLGDVGIAPRSARKMPLMNQTVAGKYKPNSSQKKKIKKLYTDDFEIYEKALVV